MYHCYQGQQHYIQKQLWGQEFDIRLSRDIKKKIACDEFQFTLVQVPHWWNCEEISLAATLKKARPYDKVVV
jgi:hypothetical protein